MKWTSTVPIAIEAPARVLLRLPDDAHLLGEVEDLVGTLDDRGLDRRDVERQLDRLAHPDRAAFGQVGVAGA